jgi:hypothetical protein
MDTQLTEMKKEFEVVEHDKISKISLLSEDQKSELMAGVKYHPIPYMPISKDFVQKYILNNVEYPVLEGKLSQAAIEMRSRFNNLVDSNFECERIKLEIQSLELDIEDIQASDKSENRKALELRAKELDKQIKMYRLVSVKQGVDGQFKEYMTWKKTVEDCLDIIQQQNPRIHGIEDIPFDLIRMAEMEVKVNRWRQLAEVGEELTPSQKVFVMDQTGGAALPPPEHQPQIPNQARHSG